MFYLVAGRWFSAPSVKGPWQFATPTLPEDFKKIPLDHPRSRVLASVPGTRQAAEAILLAQIPQTARVNRKELKAPDVAYVGDRLDNDVRPAAASGMRAVWLRRGPWAALASEEPAGAALVVDSLTELVDRIGDVL